MEEEKRSNKRQNILLVLGLIAFVTVYGSGNEVCDVY